MGGFVKLTDVNGDVVWVRKTAIVRVESRAKRGAWVTFADGSHIETAMDAEAFLSALGEILPEDKGA